MLGKNPGMSRDSKISLGQKCPFLRKKLGDGLNRVVQIAPLRQNSNNFVKDPFLDRIIKQGRAFVKSIAYLSKSSNIGSLGPK